MKAVILAAGKGIRLNPITLTRPKPLVPVGGKPIIEHILTALRQAGIHEVILVVKYMAEKIQNHLQEGKRFGLELEFAVQEKPKGTADAARVAEPFLNEDFLLTYGDWLITAEAVAKVLQTHKEEKPPATMSTIPVENPEHYGIVELKGSYVKNIIEKPPRHQASTNQANAGIYVFSKEIFSAIKRTTLSKRAELEITDSISLLLQNGHKIPAVKLSTNEVSDVGLIWDLFRANRWVLEKARSKLEGQIEDASNLIGTVVVQEGARIRSGAYVEGPVFIGKDADIGPNCYIRPYTSIGENVRIGNACEIKNSIVMDNTHIGHLSYVGDSIIGENCNFGAGTVTANYRLDGNTVKMNVGGKVIDTGRTKLGVALGDAVKTGINALFMPGVKIGNNCWIGPNMTVRRDVPPNTKALAKQEPVC